MTQAHTQSEESAGDFPYSQQFAEKKRPLEHAAKQLQERDRKIAELQQYEWRAKREAEQRQRLEKLLELQQADHRHLSEELALLYEQFATLKERCCQLEDEKQLHLFSYEQLSSALAKTSQEKDLAQNEKARLNRELTELQELVICTKREFAEAIAEKNALEQALQHTCLCLEEEKENGHKSQQYLAKKVRDHSLLLQELEQKQQELLDLTRSQEQMSVLLQRHVDDCIAKEKEHQQRHDKVQEQLEIAQQRCQTLMRQVDEAQTLLHKERQEHRELKKMEESYSQLRALIASLGLSAPVAAPTKEEKGLGSYPRFSEVDLFSSAASYPIPNKATLFDSL